MARNMAPRCKKARRVGTEIVGLTVRPAADKCKLDVRPGQHGKAHKTTSEYEKALRAKQLIKYTYGVLEKQFRNYYFKAKRKKGSTGDVLLQLLECRLDNVVYRMGFARTRAEARQLVTHGSILVNGKSVNIPSFQVFPADRIEIKEKSKSQARIQESLLLAAERSQAAPWVDVDQKKMLGTFNVIPDRTDLPAEYNENLVVELYSK